MLSFPAMIVDRSIEERQIYNSTDNQPDNNFDSGYYNWWWTPTGEAVRYSIVAALFGAVFLYFVLGYVHARRRLRQNLPLLPYHRWMIRRAPYPPTAYAQYHAYPNMNNDYQPGYAMNSYPPPPPAYNPAEAPPPVYQPPLGASKVMADQAYSRVGEASGGEGASASVTRR